MRINSVKEAEDLIYRSYVRAIKHITEVRDEKVRKPELTRQLLDQIGSPDSGQRFILVTGSKGKGSTSRFISSLLSHLGFKVGLFTSPHLVDFNERIRVDGKAIPDQYFIRIANEIKDTVLSIEAELADAEYQGPVGIALAVAVRYFQEMRTDINVIECGRGGKYDDTNVLKNEWAVITPIMEEHVLNLGPSLEQIVEHKLGIIKAETKKVYVNKQSQTVEQLMEIKMEATKKYFRYAKEFSIDSINLTANGTKFDVQTNNNFYKGLTVPLLGEFQALNAGIAIKLAEDVLGKPLDAQIVQDCLANIQWPGRCELVQRDPIVILDGAINQETAEYVKEVIAIINQDVQRNTISIVSVPANKDYEGVIKVLSTVSDQIIVTVPDISHLPFPEDDLDLAQKYKANSVKYATLEQAFSYAKEKAGLIAIVGTQTFIGNAKRLFGHSLRDIGK